MLEPQTRAALTDLLHPPPGFTLSHAVATTFTLDLDTALTIPMAFAARHVTAGDDPIGILDAVRRVASSIDVFAQAGQLSIEVPPSALVAFLEPMVHPVEVGHGIFHPKVWILEYVRGDELAYRFICASRNLTNDRSWDVVVAVDGVPASAAELGAAQRINEPIVQLMRALPGLAVTPMQTERRQRVMSLADRIRDVAWTPPPGVRDLRFHVWGVGKRPSPQFGGVRGLFVSPFLTDAGLSEIKKGAYGEAYLVSRPASIEGLAPLTIDKKLKQIYVLDDAAELGGDREEGEPSRTSLRGLHAKTYVFDRQDGAHVFLGSLNATGPALHENIEVMVEAVGKINSFGVAKTLDGLKEFLQEFDYSGALDEGQDEVADRALGAVLRRIAGTRTHVRVVGSDTYEMHFWMEEPVALPPDLEVTWHPVTRTGLQIPGLPGLANDPAVIADLGLTEITPFVIVTARDARGERLAQRTVVVAELHDDPTDRHDAVIATQLTDRAAFLRFLLLLLEVAGVPLPQSNGAGTWAPNGVGGLTGAGLFEALMRAVGPDTTGLAEAKRVIDYLARQTGELSHVLPDGFEALWDSVWAAQQLLQEGQDG